MTQVSGLNVQTVQRPHHLVWLVVIAEPAGFGSDLRPDTGGYQVGNGRALGRFQIAKPRFQLGESRRTNPVNLVECNPVLNVFHAGNNGAFKRYVVNASVVQQAKNAENRRLACTGDPERGQQRYGLKNMAERTGFEPAVSLHPHTLSRRAH